MLKLNSGLTNQQTNDIKRIQKLAMQIILQDGYINYQSACRLFSTETLAERRLKLCSKFAYKNMKSENTLFTSVTTTANTRQKANNVREFKCHTGRFLNSSLPFLAKLLNSR